MAAEFLFCQLIVLESLFLGCVNVSHLSFQMQGGNSTTWWEVSNAKKNLIMS